MSDTRSSPERRGRRASRTHRRTIHRLTTNRTGNFLVDASDMAAHLPDARLGVLWRCPALRSTSKTHVGRDGSVPPTCHTDPAWSGMSGTHLSGRGSGVFPGGAMTLRRTSWDRRGPLPWVAFWIWGGRYSCRSSCRRAHPRPTATAGVAIVAPSAASFPAVATFLEQRCGTLDCHGQVGRSLRLYGFDGLRLDPTGDVPGAGSTTTDEVDADYQSVVGLRARILAAVVQDGGARPERLTLVRKARGTEHHKGGALITPGDAQDRCLTSWLAGAVDEVACADALTTP